MSMWVAVDIAIAIVLVVNLLLTVAIVRRLRTGTIGAREADLRPQPGFKVELDRDEGDWPLAAQRILSGVVAVAFVSPRCEGCEKIRTELNRADATGYPLYLIVNGDDQRANEFMEELEEWPHVSGVYASPGPANVLNSFDSPQFVPTVVLLANGRVVACSYRLQDIPGLTYHSSIAR